MKRKKKKKKKDPKGIKNLRKASPAQVAKAFAGEVMLLSKEAADKFDGEILPSGLKSLDEALGVGGFPRGRVVEIYGMESSGKTALCLHLIGCAQRAGGKGGIVDVENALNINHARQVGVNIDELLLSQPDGGEEAMALVLKLLKSKAVHVLVVDSVAQLQPMKEREKGIEGSTMGGQAQLMSKSMRFLKREALRSGTLLIFINQIRYKIGVVFGNPETTPGGMALRFAADIRIAMRAKGPYKNKGKILGFESRLRIVKNKVGIPFTNARLRLRYGEGWRSLKPIDEKDEK